MEKYRIVFHDTEEWCKVWRKNDYWFQKRHEEFIGFLPNYSKVQNFHLDGLFLFEIYEIWAKKIRKSCISWHWTVMQSLYKPQSCSLKNDIRNWVKFHCSTQRLKNCSLMGSFYQNHMFQLQSFKGIMCSNTEGWCKI